MIYHIPEKSEKPKEYLEPTVQIYIATGETNSHKSFGVYIARLCGDVVLSKRFETISRQRVWLEAVVESLKVLEPMKCKCKVFIRHGCDSVSNEQKGADANEDLWRQVKKFKRKHKIEIISHGKLNVSTGKKNFKIASFFASKATNDELKFYPIEESLVDICRKRDSKNSHKKKPFRKREGNITLPENLKIPPIVKRKNEFIDPVLRADFEKNSRLEEAKARRKRSKKINRTKRKIRALKTA